MNQLTSIAYEGEKITVSGRELHEFLEVTTRYNDWFPRMAEYGFVEGADFNLLKNERVQIEGSREVTREFLDHQITINMAKEIAMLQRTERGKQARLYFLQIERAWNTPEAVMSRALQMANNHMEGLRATNAQMQLQIEADRGKVLFADAVTASDNSILIGQMAKILKQNGIEIGQKRLFAWLRENGYLMKGGSDMNTPTQRAMKMGLFEIKKTAVIVAGTREIAASTTMVTGKGQVYFVDKFLNKTA